MDTPNLAAALVAAQKDMPKVEADSVNPHFKSKFVSLDHLIAKTRPVLNKHGLAIVQQPAGTIEQPALVTTIYHVSGEHALQVMPLLVEGNNMQKLGAAITYARRFAWAALLGISEQEDDDGNAASAPSKPAARPAQAAAGTQPASTPKAAADPTPAAATPSGKDLAALYELVKSKGGDEVKTATGAQQASDEGKLAAWYAKAKAHWDAQPVPFEIPEAAKAKAA